MVVDIETVSAKASAYAAHVRSMLPVNKAYIFGSYAKGVQIMQGVVLSA